MTEADYTDDLPLLVITFTPADFLLQSQEQAAGGIGLHVNANKIEYIYFKQKRALSTLSHKPQN